MQAIQKVIRDGKVAVLYSPGFGAGWYSWNRSTPACLFSPEIVAMLERDATTDEIADAAERLWPDGYWGGARDLTIKWLPVGTMFRIDEYDGAESVEVNTEIEWQVA